MPMWQDPHARRGGWEGTSVMPAGWGETFGANWGLSWGRINPFDAFAEYNAAAAHAHQQLDVVPDEAPDMVLPDIPGLPIGVAGPTEALADVAPTPAQLEQREAFETAVEQDVLEQQRERLEPLAERTAEMDRRGGSRVAAFLGQASAEMANPVNLALMALPGLGWASIGARAGVTLGRVALRAGVSEAALGVAAEAATLKVRRTSAEALGEDFSAAEALAWGAAGGFAFGAALPVAGAGIRRLVKGKPPTKVEALQTIIDAAEAGIRNGIPMKAQRAATIGLRKALVQAEAEADMPPALAREYRGRVVRVEEAMALGRAWDEALANPQGKWDDLSVVINADSIERAIVSRGGLKGEHGDLTITGAGFGIVKIQVKHGPGRNEPEALQIHRADLQALPDIIRSEPLPPRTHKPPDLRREWVVSLPGLDGKTRDVVVAVKQFEEDGKGAPQRLVTMHVLEKGKNDPRDAARVSPGSPSGDSSPTEDTALVDLIRYQSGGQAGAGTTQNVTPDGAEINAAAAPQGLSADGAAARVRSERARVVALPDDVPTPQETAQTFDEVVAAVEADPRLLELADIDDDGVGRRLTDDLEDLKTERADAKQIEGCSIDAPKGA